LLLPCAGRPSDHLLPIVREDQRKTDKFLAEAVETVDDVGADDVVVAVVVVVDMVEQTNRPGRMLLVHFAPLPWKQQKKKLNNEKRHPFTLKFLSSHITTIISFSSKKTEKIKYFGVRKENGSERRSSVIPSARGVDTARQSQLALFGKSSQNQTRLVVPQMMPIQHLLSLFFFQQNCHKLFIQRKEKPQTLVFVRNEKKENLKKENMK
jgi:hypothetical protein